MNTTVHATAFALWLILVGAVPGQDEPPARAYHTASASIVIGSEAARCSVLPHATPTSGQMALFKVVFAGASPTLSFQLPFEYVGGLIELASGEFIVSGASASVPPVGFLTRLTIDTIGNTIVHRETVTYPGMDPLCLAWHNSLPVMMTLDKASDSLQLGVLVWPPPAPDAGWLPAILSPVMNANQCPTIRGVDPRLSASGGHFSLKATRLGSPVAISFNGSSWVVTPPHPLRENAWDADDTLGHMGPLRVRTYASALGPDNTFAVRNVLRNAVVAQSAVQDVAEWVNLVAPADFYTYPGYPFIVTGPLSGDSQIFNPLLRYGEPTQSGAFTPQRALIVASTLYQGSPGAVCLCPTRMVTVEEGSESDPPMLVSGYLLVGLASRGETPTPDPIVGRGQNARLQFYAALDVTLRQVWRGGAVAHSVAVPDDPNLQDFVVLTQWAFVNPYNPSELVYSDIAGARVRPPESSMAVGSALSVPARSGSRQLLELTLMRKRLRASAEQSPSFVTPSTGHSALWSYYLDND